MVYEPSYRLDAGSYFRGKIMEMNIEMHLKS